MYSYTLSRIHGLSILSLVFAALSPTLVVPGTAYAQDPIVSEETVFVEKDGLLAVEAEHYFKQTASDVRAFYLTHADKTPEVVPDGDPNHAAGASGGAYLEILPDTRRTHDDKLIRGTNFAPEPGKMAVLHYKVHVNTPGRYYIWVRAHSTGSEDNGLHVGLDGTWPASGQRLQWCQGKRTWRWESKQRTEAQHCGEPYKIYLDIDKPGEHLIHFSMREDGFEFDKWLMTLDREFERPSDGGPDTRVMRGELPQEFRIVATMPTIPADNQLVRASEAPSGLDMPATMFAEGKVSNYYVHGNKWLAIDPEKHEQASAERTFPYPTGIYDIVLQTVGENDGRSSYSLAVDGEKVGDYRNPLSQQMYEEGESFNKTWKKIQITEGAVVRVSSEVGSEDGKEFSRARWLGVRFVPANAATQKLAAPILRQQTANAAKPAAEKPTSSPTTPVSTTALHQPREANGDGAIKVSGELKQWHKITIDLNGPYAHEHDNQPNPFTDYRMTVRFKHADGTELTVPGYFAADGDAANSSAQSGTVWRAHFAPSKTGKWSYKVAFVEGKRAALDAQAQASALGPYDGGQGAIEVAASDKSGRDLRAQGQLRYVGKHYLQFAGSKAYFLKVGADAPETLLAYEDFDNTLAGNPNKAPLKSWSPHLRDWKTGDPSWGDGKGKGLIGAINYLSAKGCNAFSFLTYNAGGDGDNVWPFVQREDKLHYDCSKLDQWAIVFEHGTARGMYLHFKMQETENDDHRRGKGGGGTVPECLDGGNLGDQRRLYCRELVARFGHNLALNWNLGEENTQTTKQQQAMINYIAELDAYDHNIVVHTFPGQHDQVYGALIGDKSKLTGVSLQNSSLEATHADTLRWVQASARAGKPWIVAFDESGSAAHAQCPDLGYKGFDGHDRSGKMVYTQHKVRKQTLWGTLMAGGAGNEYYFGYQFAENDIVCEDWRSRDQSWDYCRHAINFFHDNDIPFWEMVGADELVGNPSHGVSKFCFIKPDDTYLVYLADGGTSQLDLSAATGAFSVQWFNPREGGDLTTGSVKTVRGGGSVSLGNAPTDGNEDWLVVVRKAN